MTLDEWISANRGKSRSAIINQERSQSLSPLHSQPGGPILRYVFHPITGNVIDMRHMLVVGRYGKLVGDLVEYGQASAGMPSGHNPQDYYSNRLGFGFYKVYDDPYVSMFRSIGLMPSFTNYLDKYLRRTP